MKTKTIFLCALCVLCGLTSGSAGSKISALPPKPSPSPADYFAVIDKAAHDATPNAPNAYQLSLGGLQTFLGVLGTIPDMTGQSGKFLTNNGTIANWGMPAGGGDALIAQPLSQFASTTSLQLAGVISNETGTGLLVFGTSPTLTTPNLGTPSAITLTNGTGLPATGIGSGTIAQARLGTGSDGSGSHFLADDQTYKTITGGGDALVANPLSQFASTTSAQLAAVLSNETGTGLAVFGTTPAFTTNITTPKVIFSTSVFDSTGTGSPEGAVTANVGSTFRRTDGGTDTTFYRKETGSGNTGWSASTSGEAALAPAAVKTGAYTAAVNDLVPVDATSGSVTITLPTAPADKARVAVKLVATTAPNNCTIAAGGSDVMNKTGGSTSLTLRALNESYMLQYKASGAIWYAVASDVPLNSGTDIALAGGTAISMGYSQSDAISTGPTYTFSGTASSALRPTVLKLNVSSGPVTVTIPSSQVLGGAAAITSLVLQNGYHELTWTYASGAWWLNDPTDLSMGAIIDPTDNTKQAVFSISLFTTGTTRTIFVAPGGNSTTVVPGSSTNGTFVTGIGTSGAVTTGFRGVSSPASLGTDQNDWTPATTNHFIRVVLTANIHITGLNFTNTAGEWHRIINATTTAAGYTLTLDHESTSTTTVTRRMDCDTAADIVLSPKQQADIFYDGTDVNGLGARWRVVKLP